jgi:hypothetical protein
MGGGQGRQMVCFQTKNPSLGKFWRALDWKMLIYFTAIWNILQAFGTFYDHSVHFVFIWYIFGFWYHVPRKSGKPFGGHKRTNRKKVGVGGGEDEERRR